jgi:hypothetical protein
MSVAQAVSQSQTGCTSPQGTGKRRCSKSPFNATPLIRVYPAGYFPVCPLTLVAASVCLSPVCLPACQFAPPASALSADDKCLATGHSLQGMHAAHRWPVAACCEHLPVLQRGTGAANNDQILLLPTCPRTRPPQRLLGLCPNCPARGFDQPCTYTSQHRRWPAVPTHHLGRSTAWAEAAASHAGIAQSGRCTTSNWHTPAPPNQTALLAPNQVSFQPTVRLFPPTTQLLPAATDSHFLMRKTRRCRAASLGPSTTARPRQALAEGQKPPAVLRPGRRPPRPARGAPRSRHHRGCRRGSGASASSGQTPAGRSCLLAAAATHPRLSLQLLQHHHHHHHTLSTRPSRPTAPLFQSSCSDKRYMSWIGAKGPTTGSTGSAL